MTTLANYPFLTSKQVANLGVLARHLEALPKSYKHFDMTVYFNPGRSGIHKTWSDAEEHWQDEQLRKYTWNSTDPLNHCGTTACAVGHGPAAGIPVRRGLRAKLPSGGFTVDWDQYAGEAFTGHNKLLWNWCFSGQWGGIDNTPHGAAARIRWVLANRPIPELIFSYGRDRGNAGTLVADYAEYLV